MTDIPEGPPAATYRCKACEATGRVFRNGNPWRPTKWRSDTPVHCAECNGVGRIFRYDLEIWARPAAEVEP